MANPKKRLPQNVAGEFFVDSTCINCDACRQLAPATFADSGEYSFVFAQPRTAEEQRQAVHALLACPTGSIGTVHSNNASEVKADYPLPIEGGVYYCGYNSPKSFGGNSYFIQHPAGNWLIDSPKYLQYLVGRLEELGGIRYIFLTHRDDVADAGRYAQRFGSQRIIHRQELDSQPDAERNEETGLRRPFHIHNFGLINRNIDNLRTGRNNLNDSIFFCHSLLWCRLQVAKR